MRGSTQYSKSAAAYFPFNFTPCVSHKDKWAVYDVRVGANAIAARGLSFDAARSLCDEKNGNKSPVYKHEIDSDDLYPVQVILIGNDWKATNHITGEVSESGFQSYKEAIPAAHKLFNKWINVDKCVAA